MPINFIWSSLLASKAFGHSTEHDSAPSATSTDRAHVNILSKAKHWNSLCWPAVKLSIVDLVLLQGFPQGRFHLQPCQQRNQTKKQTNTISVRLFVLVLTNEPQQDSILTSLDLATSNGQCRVTYRASFSEKAVWPCCTEKEKFTP